MIEINIDWTKEFDNSDDLIKISGTAVDDIYWANYPLEAATIIMHQLEKIYVEMQERRIQANHDKIKVGDRVRIMKGIFEGFYGEITNIWSLGSANPLTIKVDNSNEFSNCTCYASWDSVEKILK